MTEDDVPLAKIGRPGIGGDFLQLVRGRYDRYRVLRFKQTNGHRADPRKLDVPDVPAFAMLDDLLRAIEALVDDAAEVGAPLYPDDRGLAGDAPTKRERIIDLLAKL